MIFSLNVLSQVSNTSKNVIEVSCVCIVWTAVTHPSPYACTHPPPSYAHTHPPNTHTPISLMIICTPRPLHTHTPTPLIHTHPPPQTHTPTPSYAHTHPPHMHTPTPLIRTHPPPHMRTPSPLIRTHIQMWSPSPSVFSLLSSLLTSLKPDLASKYPSVHVALLSAQFQDSRFGHWFVVLCRLSVDVKITILYASFSCR